VDTLHANTTHGAVQHDQLVSKLTTATNY